MARRHYGNPGAGLKVQNDGNVVLYRANGSAAWFTGWDRTGLFAGQYLSTGQQVTSANGRYHLILQPDGNVVVYTSETPGRCSSPAPMAPGSSPCRATATWWPTTARAKRCGTRAPGARARPG